MWQPCSFKGKECIKELGHESRDTKRKRSIFMTLVAHRCLWVLCATLGDVTENNNNGVWKQELARACGERRIYTAFLEAKLEINA